MTDHCMNGSAATLTVGTDTPRDGYSPAVIEMAHRFFRCASLLPQGCLNWLYDPAADACRVYVSDGARATLEDYSWIFTRCFTAALADPEDITDPFAEGREVYQILYAPNLPSLYLLDDSEEPSRSAYGELLKCLGEAGGVLLIRVGAGLGKGPGSGGVYFSLPGEISLRLRGLTSLAFPEKAVFPVSQPLPDSQPYEVRPLYPNAFMDIMARLTLELIRQEKEREEEKTPPQDAQADPEDPDGLDDLDDLPDLDETDPANTDGGYQNVALEDLGLSVRAYNCLKREGILTLGQLMLMDEEDLLKVRHLGKRGAEEVLDLIARYKLPDPPSPPPAERDYKGELEELIGLREVKEKARQILAYARLKRDLAAEGEEMTVALNMEFVGNPGTAKTTVARLMAGIFYQAGLLESPEILEAGRAQIVDKYVGHTAVKVRELFEKEKGKLLFIDEAYSLVDDREGSFGDEAIDAIVQEMENRRRETVVIFAGYPRQMEEFFSRNPGLRSRVPFTLNFQDYTPDEMTLIAEAEAKKRGFALSPDGCDKVRLLCDGSRDGNGRFCRNLVEEGILRYALRVYGDGEPAEQQSRILIADDFPEPTDDASGAKPPIGFCA